MFLKVMDAATEHCSSSPAARYAIGMKPRAIPIVASVLLTLTLIAAPASADDPPRNHARIIEHGPMPKRVHVFEDYETEIEKRWWMRGEPVTDVVPPSLSRSTKNTRACRATLTKDFDRKMGDQARQYKAVIFNPVPGPPMGKNTRLFFRYRLRGTDRLRVQIYSLSNGYHRHLVLTGLPEGRWQAATVDMTAARRPDGSGGPLSEDERIDDIQFYIDDLDADLWIDDIVLYEAAVKNERRAFPRRAIFTGWFDTGKQGEGHEWPGRFEIVKHEPPRTWDAAKSVADEKTGAAIIEIDMRGRRSLSASNRLRFDYQLTGADAVKIELVDTKKNASLTHILPATKRDAWQTADVPFEVNDKSQRSADVIRFTAPTGATLLIDDLLLYEPRW